MKNMIRPFSRRQFVASTAALAASTLIPRRLFAASASTNQRVLIRTVPEVGVVRPEFHGHFVEHLGSCVYPGLLVGKNSPLPNVDGYRKRAVEYLKDFDD
jgi:alpha-N-arabinofuranosidase